MHTSNGIVTKAYYSLELKNQICKDHLENNLGLRDCARKYNLTSHSLVPDWLRQLGYVAGENRRTRSAYIGSVDFKTLPNNQKNKTPQTPEQLVTVINCFVHHEPWR